MSNSFYEPFYDINRFFEEAFPSASSLPNSQLQSSRRGHEGRIQSFRPRMDIHEDAEKNVVTATFELPGVSRDDIHIDLQNGRLVVLAEMKNSSDKEENGYAIRERYYGKLSRTLQLPQGVKEEEIKASMEHGVLTLTFPKTVPESAPRRITVS